MPQYQSSQSLRHIKPRLIPVGPTRYRTPFAGPVRALCSVPLPGRAVFLACGGDDGALQFWSPTTGRLVGEIVPGERGKAVRSLCAVPVANQQAGLAVTGGGWTPDGAHWPVAMYYPSM